MTRNTNATIATTSCVHVTTRLLAGIIDVLSSYMAILILYYYKLILKARHLSVSRDLAEERTTCCGEQLELATRIIMLKKVVHNFSSFQYSLSSITNCLIAKVILSLFFIFPHTVSCKYNFVKGNF